MFYTMPQFIVNPAGEIQGIFAAARDITERKAMENDLNKH